MKRISKILMLSAITAVFCITSAISAVKFEKMPTNKYFFIQSVQAGNSSLGYWDQPGAPRRYKNGINIQCWDLPANDRRSPDRQFRFISAGGDYYFIRSKNGGYVDISGGKNGNGVNIQIWEPNRSKAQKFRFRHMRNGKWKIYTVWNRAICTNNRKHTNGTNIHTWADHNGAWMEWYIKDARTMRKYQPKETPKFSRNPEFFIKNKDKAFKYTSSTLVGRNEGTAYLVRISGRAIYLYVTYTGRNPMNGKVETNSRVMRLYYDYKKGEYHDGQKDREFRLVGKAKKDAKLLSMSHSQGGVTLEVTNKSKATAYPKNPDFFIKNKDKTFTYYMHSMSGRTEGTAKVKSIKGNTIVLSVEYTINKKVYKKDVTLYLKDGVYTYNHKNYDTWGIASAGSKKLDIRGEQSSEEFIVKK